MFFSLFLSVLFVLTYVFLFYLSASTPLSKAATVDLITILAYIVTFSFVVASIGYVLSVLLCKLFNVCNKLKDKTINKAIITIILFFGFLLLVENWSYSVLGFGLKTSESALQKITIFAISLFLAFQFSGGVRVLSLYLNKYKNLVLFTIIVISSFVLFASIKNWNDNNVLTVNSGLVGERYNVVILSSDGINASEMSIYGSMHETTPFLHSKASEFMVFKNAYSNNANTTGSIISMLNGMLPLTTKVVYPPDILTGEESFRSLPKILGEAGYYRTLWAVPHYADADAQNLLGAFDINNGRKRSLIDIVSNYLNLTGIQRWFFLNSSKDLYGVTADVLFIKELDNPYSHVQDSPVVRTTNNIKLNDQQRLAGMINDIEIATERGQPFFILTHLMTSHGAKFHTTSRHHSEGIDQKENWMPPFYRDSIIDFDKAIEQVYLHLKNLGQLEKTILIITSDHGQKYNNKNKIPMLIRLPNINNIGNYDVNVQLVDLAPTILDQLGWPIPEWMDGSSLLAPESIPLDRYILITGSFDNIDVGGHWVRKNKNFAASNVYSVVHCDSYMTSKYPVKFKTTEKSGIALDAACQNLSMAEIARTASLLVESKLQ